MNTVSGILSAEHGLTIHPGRSGECPFCHGRHFSVRKDDRIGKCFSPNCGEYILHEDYTRNTIARSINRCLRPLYTICHRTLLDNPAWPAYRYLMKRHILPEVVADSMIGAVPMEAVDVAALFAKEIEHLTEAAAREAKAAAEEKSNKKRKDPREPAESILRQLEEARGKLEETLRACAGWLAFFYTDEHHRLTSIKLRKPDTKNFSTFRAYDRLGVFNHSLYLGSEKALPNRPLIVTEGEFNTLQLQSAMRRWSNNPEVYQYACSVGGVNAADLITLRALSSRPVVIYDNDDNGAGKTLVQALQEVCTVSATTVPSPYNDLDEYLVSLGSNGPALYESLKELVDSKPETFYRRTEAVKEAIDRVRLDDGLKVFERHRAAGEIVLEDLQRRGTFYRQTGTNRAYLFLQDRKLLVAVDADSYDYELLLQRYGIAPSEDLFQYTTDLLRLHAIEHGFVSPIYSNAHYDSVRDVCYVFNQGDTVYRVSAEGVEACDNGVDGVLFLRGKLGEPFQINVAEAAALQPGDVNADFNRLILRANFQDQETLQSHQRESVLFVWILGLFFPELFPTRPLICFVGEHGSGKSWALKRIGVLLFGAGFKVMQMPDDPRDMDTALTNLPLACLDNADTGRDWLEDKLALAATGGTVTRRELHTTNRMVEYPVQAFVGITSRTPYFRREDVADRLLIFKLQSLLETESAFRSERVLVQEIVERRNAFMTYLVGCVRQAVIALKATKHQEFSSVFRIADYASFALKLAAGGGDAAQAAMYDVLGKLREEQGGFATDGDPLPMLLEEWAKTYRSVEFVEWHILMKYVQDESYQYGYDFPWRGKPRAFRQRVMNLRTTLSFLTMEEEVRGGRRRFVRIRSAAKAATGTENKIA